MSAPRLVDYQELGQTRERSVFTFRKDYPEFLFDDRKLRLVLCQLVWNLAKDGRNAGRVPENLANDLGMMKLIGDVAWLRYCQSQSKDTREAVAFKTAVTKCGGILNLFTIVLWSYRMGASSCEIAESTGMSPVAVRQRLLRIRRLAQKLLDGSLVDRPRAAKKAAQPKRKKRGAKRTFSYAAAKRMADAGIPTKDISVKLGVSRRQVQAVLRETKRAATIAPICA
jgi:hypothetical protein